MATSEKDPTNTRLDIPAIQKLLGTDKADAAGNLDLAGTLDVTGVATLDSDLAVAGNVGLYGVAPVAQAAAITPPTEVGVIFSQSELETLGTAIDAIIVALHNVGIIA
jgi:hypothetical protein